MTVAASAFRPWLITRPAAAGRALTAALSAGGYDARWLPAFEIGPVPDPSVARAALAQLAEVDLAIFVSPAAVRETRRLLGSAEWPPGTAIGAVGAMTADTARELLARPDGQPLTVIAPEAAASGSADPQGDAAIEEADAGSGSEALMQALGAYRLRLAGRGASTVPLRRALLLRAEHGRNWLIEQLGASGMAVEPVAVYVRRARSWDAADRAWVDARIDGAAPVLVVTSSEAVDALIDAVTQALPAALPWLRRGRALALHPRIVERLHAAGFADAACVPCTPEALMAAV